MRSLQYFRKPNQKPLNCRTGYLDWAIYLDLEESHKNSCRKSSSTNLHTNIVFAKICTYFVSIFRTLEEYFYENCIRPEGDDIDDEDFRIKVAR